MECFNCGFPTKTKIVYDTEVINGVAVDVKIWYTLCRVCGEVYPSNVEVIER